MSDSTNDRNICCRHNVSRLAHHWIQWVLKRTKFESKSIPKHKIWWLWSKCSRHLPLLPELLLSHLLSRPSGVIVSVSVWPVAMCGDSTCKGKPRPLPCFTTPYSAFVFTLCTGICLVDLNYTHRDDGFSVLSALQTGGVQFPQTMAGWVNLQSFLKRSSFLLTVPYQFPASWGIWQRQNCSALQGTATPAPLSVGSCTRRVQDRFTTSVGCSAFKVADISHITQLYRLDGGGGAVLHSWRKEFCTLCCSFRAWIGELAIRSAVAHDDTECIDVRRQKTKLSDFLDYIDTNLPGDFLGYLTNANLY